MNALNAPQFPVSKTDRATSLTRAARGHKVTWRGSNGTDLHTGYVTRVGHTELLAVMTKAVGYGDNQREIGQSVWAVPFTSVVEVSAGF